MISARIFCPLHFTPVLIPAIPEHGQRGGQGLRRLGSLPEQGPESQAAGSFDPADVQQGRELWDFENVLKHLDSGGIKPSWKIVEIC